MKIIDNKYELPISIIFGVVAPIYWVLEFPVRAGGGRFDMTYAADAINATGTSFVIGLVAAFCLANARKVRATTSWMKAWSWLLKIWLLFTFGSIFFVWLPQIR